MKKYKHFIEQMIDEKLRELLDKKFSDAFEQIKEYESKDTIMNESLLISCIEEKTRRVWEEILGKQEVKAAIVLNEYKHRKLDIIFLEFGSDEESKYGIVIDGAELEWGGTKIEWARPLIGLVEEDFIKCENRFKYAGRFERYYRLFIEDYIDCSRILE